MLLIFTNTILIVVLKLKDVSHTCMLKLCDMITELCDIVKLFTIYFLQITNSELDLATSLLSIVFLKRG